MNGNMNNSLEQLLADSSFVAWLKGKCPQEEQARWEQWLREDPEHQILVREAKEIVLAVSSEYDIPDPEKELERLDKIITRHESQKKHEQVIFTFARDNQPYRAIGRRVAAAAIVIAVLLGGAGGYYTNTQSQAGKQEIAETPRVDKYRTDYGEKLTFRLSDGSRITLNGNSSLTFSSTVKKGLNTEVWLEGEAYFDIAHLEGSQQRTFTVQTDDGAIRVLGTRFAVNTFRGETRTVLEEGQVTVKNAGSPATYKLVPGQLARFKSHDNKVAIKEVNTQLYTSWTEDKFMFVNTPMAEVSERVEDIFGVEIVLAEPLKRETLSGSIKSTNLNVLQKALEEILKTEITRQGNQLLIGPG